MGLSRYNVIYGSFSALPLFLIWVYLNWLILLFGVTLSYLYQKYDYASKRARDHERTLGEKRLMALMLAAEIANDFAMENPPPTEVQLSKRLNLSPTMTAELINNLLQSNVISATATNEYDSPGFHPSLFPFLIPSLLFSSPGAGWCIRLPEGRVLFFGHSGSRRER